MSSIQARASSIWQAARLPVTQRIIPQVAAVAGIDMDDSEHNLLQVRGLFG